MTSVTRNNSSFARLGPKQERRLPPTFFLSFLPSLLLGLNQRLFVCSEMTFRILNLFSFEVARMPEQNHILAKPLKYTGRNTTDCLVDRQFAAAPFIRTSKWAFTVLRPALVFR